MNLKIFQNNALNMHKSKNIKKNRPNHGSLQVTVDTLVDILLTYTSYTDVTRGFPNHCDC